VKPTLLTFREEQHSLRTSLSELQAEFQRFRADMEARTQQADNSATSVLQAEKQKLRDQLAIAFKPHNRHLSAYESVSLFRRSAFIKETGVKVS
jgi:hypothetical protein